MILSVFTSPEIFFDQSLTLYILSKYLLDTFTMYNFQEYYDLRQAGYDPREVGSGMLRNIRATLKEYVKRIESKGGEGTWGDLKSKIQELYRTLSSPLEPMQLSQEVEKHIGQLQGLQSEDRMQNGIRLSVIRMLDGLRNYIADQTGQAD